MYLANLSSTAKVVTEKKEVSAIEVDDLFVNEDNSTVTSSANEVNIDNKRLKVISMIPVETIKKDDVTPIGGN